jgi:hypothetical protein
MSHYIGITPADLINSFSKRYFYGIRRNDDGEIFLGKYDQLVDEVLVINLPGNTSENFPNFTEGQDFFEGRDQFHELIYENLNYEQFRWDGRSLTYTINEDGEFVLRTDG